MASQLNAALSLALLSPESSIFTPVAASADTAALPGIHWSPHRPFHASALCAAALDSVTFPLRIGATPTPSTTGTQAAARASSAQ